MYPSRRRFARTLYILVGLGVGLHGTRVETRPAKFFQGAILRLSELRRVGDVFVIAMTARGDTPARRPVFDRHSVASLLLIITPGWRASTDTGEVRCGVLVRSSFDIDWG